MKRLLVLVLVLVAAVAAFGQDGDTQSESRPTLVERYIENFRTANLETKEAILAASESEDLEEMAPLYAEALSFLIDNAGRLSRNTVLQDMSEFVVEKLTEAEYAPAAESLWRLFMSREESLARVSILEAIAVVGEGNDQVAVFLNQWISDRNSLRAGGEEVDRQVLYQAVVTAGALGNPSSFPILLETRLLQISEAISNAAEDAMQSLDGNLLELAAEALEERDPGDKAEAFTYYTESDLFNEEEQAVLAQAALNQVLRSNTSDPTVAAELRQMRYRAANVVREAALGDATRAMIRHFNQTVLEYDRGVTPKSRVLEAVAGLGAMDSDEAAVRLTDYLELLNTYTELDRPYDTQIVLAVIRNLQRLGRPGSYNALFYCTLLDYPTRVKEAAQEAMRAVSR